MDVCFLGEVYAAEEQVELAGRARNGSEERRIILVIHFDWSRCVLHASLSKAGLGRKGSGTAEQQRLYLPSLYFIRVDYSGPKRRRVSKETRRRRRLRKSCRLRRSWIALSAGPLRMRKQATYPNANEAGTPRSGRLRKERSISSVTLWLRSGGLFVLRLKMLASTRAAKC